MTDNDIPDQGPLALDTTNPPEVLGRPMDHKLQPKQARRGPVPARQTNGYYADHVTGDRLRSVTTILSGGVPKPALVHWAGNMCTDSAIEHLPQLVAASRHPEQLEELRRWIRKAHTRKKDERADVGSAVHTVIESRITGAPVPSAIKVGKDEDGQDLYLELDGPEIGPILAHFYAFESEWKPAWTASEMVVANPEDGWAGTLDYMIGDGPIADALRGMGFAVPKGVDLMGDTKTGGELDKVTYSGHYHGVYPEAGLQMSAYRRAKVAWLPGGERIEMPPTAEVGIVLHLRPEGYRIYPARCGDLQYRYFRHAQMVDEWASRLASAKAAEPIIGKPLVLPGAAEAVA